MMNNSQSIDNNKTTIEGRNSQARYSIFRNMLFKASHSFTKVPLHFEFTDKAVFVLNHGDSSEKGDQGQTDFRRDRKSSSRHKIFQKKRSFSLKSGFFSTTDDPDKKDTISSSQDRIRKGTIFKESNTVAVRQEREMSIQESMKDLVEVTKQQNQKHEQKYFLFKQVQNQRLGRPSLIEQIIYTPEQLRMMKGKQKKNKKIIDQPLKPCQFFNLMNNIIESKRSKKSANPRVTAKIGNFMPATTPFCPKGKQSRADQQNWLYRI